MSYASAVRRSPPPLPPLSPPPNQTNHNGGPYHNDRRPRGHCRADGRAGGPGADNRARNAQNGCGNNNNTGIITGNGEYVLLNKLIYIWYTVVSRRVLS